MTMSKVLPLSDVMSGGMSPWGPVTVIFWSSRVTPRTKFFSLRPLAFMVKAPVLVVWDSMDWPMTSVDSTDSSLVL